MALLSRISPGDWGGMTSLALFGLAFGLIGREKRRLIIQALRTEREAWAAFGGGAERRMRWRVRSPSLGWKMVSYVLIFALFAADDRIWNLAAHADCPIPANSSTSTTRITQFVYDNDGHLTQINAPEGVVNYGYDAATGRHTLTCTTNSQVAYGYDQLGRLKTAIVIKRNGTTLTTPETNSYSYTPVGNRSTVTLANGVVTTYLYDNLNRLTNVASMSGSTNLANYGYVLNASGRRTGAREVLRQEDTNVTYLTNNLGWTYDGMYRLITETSTSTAAAGNYTNTYSYDKAGNRLKKTQVIGANTTTVDSTFNANDQLLTEIVKTNGIATGTNTYWYDANGSLTTKSNTTGVITYAYNLQNKLGSMASGGTTNSFVYNDAGIRVSSTTSGSTKLYLIDSNNHTGYSQILEELNTVGGTPTTSYVIGDDVLGQCGTTSTAPLYLLQDGHGSTRQMANTSGAVTSRYNYDAYGTEIIGTSSGAAQTSLLYCGQQFDSTLNMYNLRARFYDPSNGRFNARDSFMGNNRDPQSLHKYAYAGVDPVNNFDPTGHEFTLIDLLVVATIAGIVVGAVTYAVTRSFKTAIIAGLGTFALVFTVGAIIIATAAAATISADAYAISQLLRTLGTFILNGSVQRALAYVLEAIS